MELHSKKSHKGNWELLDSSIKKDSGWGWVAFKEIPQRELREMSYWFYIPVESQTSMSCIQRNPTKGIERLGLPVLFGMRLAIWLHSKKSHKGNWECLWSNTIHSNKNKCCIQRNPTKGIESYGKYGKDWRSLDTHQQLHSKKSHKGNWELEAAIAANANTTLRLHSKKSHKGNWEAKNSSFPCLKVPV